MTERKNLLRAALWYAKRGFWVFPLHSPDQQGGCSCSRPSCSSPGKHPRTLSGLKDATTNEEVIRRWWTWWPGANIGIACEPSGLMVLDVDPRSGGDASLHDLVQRLGREVLETVTSLTGGGGQHLVYKAPPDTVIRSGTGKLGPGLDIKAVGGYIVAPPSLHASGRRYEWEVGYSPRDRAPALPHPWLIEHLKKPRANEVSGPASWPQLVLNGVGEGNRNNTLASVAGHLLRCGVDSAVVVGLLLPWAELRCIPPLPKDEVIRTIESIAGLELRRRGRGQPDA